MARSEPGRYWKFEQRDFDFPHKFFSGIGPIVSGAMLHINPRIPMLFQKDPPTLLLMSGAWALPTNIIVTSLSKLFGRSKLLFWSESHLNSIKLRSRPIDKVRAMLLNQYDGFAVPGRLALEYVRHFAPHKPVFDLPNIVKEDIFKDKVLRNREGKEAIRKERGISTSKKILLLSSRLIPEKGIVGFLSALSSLPTAMTREIVIVIAGDGPLRQKLESPAIKQSHLNLYLSGHVNEHEMAKLYAVADAFALPSLSDPNPLSVIEALWAGLPLLISNRVGNHCEALLPGENGWLFDPESAGDIQKAVKEWFVAPSEKIQQFGKVSAQIAEDRFSTEKVVYNFLNQVLEPE